LVSARWVLDITALTSIVHSDDSHAHSSNQALFRREKILTPTGDITSVPIISGNSLRGILRRLGEELLAPVLNYPGQLSTPAAYLLRSGGTLRKSTKTFPPEKERHLKTLIPLIGLFGGTVNGRILSGCTTISKVVPRCVETQHLLPPDTQPVPSQFSLLGLEPYFHQGDLAAATPAQRDVDATHPLSRFEIETLVAGTRLYATAATSFATPLQAAFFHDILTTFAINGHLGGRSAAGHGRIHAELTLTPALSLSTDWRNEVRAHRDEALALLAEVT